MCRIQTQNGSIMPLSRADSSTSSSQFPWKRQRGCRCFWHVSKKTVKTGNRYGDGSFALLFHEKPKTYNVCMKLNIFCFVGVSALCPSSRLSITPWATEDAGIDFLFVENSELLQGRVFQGRVDRNVRGRKTNRNSELVPGSWR